MDITLAIDEFKVVKSDEERELIREANLMHEKLLWAAPMVVRQGRSVKDINNDLLHMSIEMGSGGHFIHLFMMCGGMDEPMHPPMDARREAWPGRVLNRGDRAFLLLETNGIGGHYTAIGRWVCLGEPSESFARTWDMAVRAQKNAGRLMVPGKTFRQVADENRKFIEGCGFETNDQNYLHSLGYVYGERPYLNDVSENCPIREGMCYIAHPIIRRYYPELGPGVKDDCFALDTYHITANGGVRANAFPQELIVV